MCIRPDSWVRGARRSRAAGLRERGPDPGGECGGCPNRRGSARMGARFLGVRCSPAACSLERSRVECVEFGAEALEKRALSKIENEVESCGASGHGVVLRSVEPCFGAWSRASGHKVVLRSVEPCFEAWSCGALPSASERLGDGLWKREALREVSLIQ